jgi:hypothetical protein
LKISDSRFNRKSQDRVKAAGKKVPGEKFSKKEKKVEF